MESSFSRDVETELVDLSNDSLATLAGRDQELLARPLQRVMDQVERPRSNIGSGPPGRVD
ncbi:hypothetical protein GCM10022225_11750 [Plantactinospora mayteni]|uniref:FXSXX-COOH protein n=1 Tax=Plantactinospora mayteni TaxID=566021 RepID=A0ABQ4EH59_9ACTN|nr:hypothetical protein [Plantactinospora mayteni]GIG94073.1 hypothetical protein Pma05_06460 [Plantactinospora mayteni]